MRKPELCYCDGCGKRVGQNRAMLVTRFCDQCGWELCKGIKECFKDWEQEVNEV